MKKLIFYLIVFLVILSSCDPMADIYKEMDANNTGYKNSVQYTLLSADYSTIGTLAMNANAADATFIKSNKFFSDAVSAATYIPAFLAGKFPALSTGSSAIVTYNYSGAVPSDLTKYTNTNTYTLAPADYQSIDSVLQVTGYFSPGYAPEVYVPGILATKVASPATGDLVLATYNYSTVDPKVNFRGVGDKVIWQETFNSGLGSFTAYDLLGAQGWVASNFSTDYFAKISGYSGGNKDNEDWLISGPITLSGITNASFNFRQTTKLFGSPWSQLGVMVSSNWDGTPAGIPTATWNTLTGYALPTGLDYVFVESGKISFSSYANKTIRIAFKYLSNTTAAATWEIDRAEIVIPSVPITGLSPNVYKAYYQYNGSKWVKVDNAYYVNIVDYDAMGNPGPGKYDNFDATMPPMNYLPALLKAKYPIAGQDNEVVVAYKYFIGGTTTLTLATRYKFNNGAWVSSYDYVVPKASQFIYSTAGWIFDPTVSFTMVAADYQIIVDWVKINIGASSVDGTGKQELYTGAGAGYLDFDLGKYDKTKFATWQDAVKSAIGTVLLPSKFPAAVTQVSGVDVNYIVGFATYPPNAKYSIKFKCTKAGPNPEFTYVEGPQ
jgi:hypothetical protein